MPSRLMVLVFTDIVGSLALKSATGAAAYARTISRHDAIFREIIATLSGSEIIKDTGDGFLARFTSTTAAVSAALSFQQRMAAEPWDGEPLRVRVGIHLGEVSELANDIDGRPKIVGLAADIAARIMSLALPGQILLTHAAFDEARQFVREHPAGGNGTPPELAWVAHGRYLFQGMEDPVEVYEVGAVGLAPLRQPPDTDKCRRAVPAGTEAVLGWRPGVGLEIPGRENWILERRLGEGGFGEVWLATHRRTQLRRVFKFCFDADRLRSFKRELTLFRLLREALGERSDIARLYDIQLDHSPYFLESEFTETGNLSDWAAAQGGINQVPMETRLSLVIGTAEAVAAAHSVGILHKDIKPSNILVYNDRGVPRPRLADFGIGMLADQGKVSGRGITMSGFTETLNDGKDPSRTGTRMYAPPELLSGHAFTMQGDIYALGVVLYQMVVGDLTRPLAHGWERDVADPLLREDIAQCVAGRPQDRFTSAGELALRLARLSPRRRIHRRAQLARAATIVSLALVVLLAFAGVWILREHGLRIDAETARANAQVKQAEALTEAAKSAAVSEFLQDMLASVDPNIGAGHRDVTVREVLDAASVNFEATQQSLTSQPEVDAALRTTIGITYRSIGELDAAESHLAKALQLRTQLHGEENRETISSMMDLGALYRAQGKYDRAEPLAAKSLELAKKVAGPESRLTLHAMTNLAELHAEQGRHKDAEALFVEVFELSRRVMGEDHPDTITALNNLASSYRDQARFAEAEPLYDKLIVLSEKSLGPDHPETLIALNNIAMLYEAQGRYEEAEPIMARVLTTRKRVLGPDHPATLNSINNLAAVRSNQGKLAEAATTYREVLEASTRRLGAAHPDTVLAMINLAAVQSRLGDPTEAEALLTKALAIAEPALGPGHHLSRAAMSILAGVYSDQKRMPEAESMMLRLIELDIKTDGPDHPDTLSVMSDLAGLYQSQKLFDKAEPLYIKALAGTRKTLGEDHQQTLILTNNLASLYRDMNRLEEAEKLMDAAVNGARRTMPKDHWFIAAFLTTQGKLQTRLGQYEKAESSLLEAHASLKASMGADNPRTQEAIRSLGNLYDAWNKPDQAAHWREQLSQPSTQPSANLLNRCDYLATGLDPALASWMTA